MKAIKVVVLAAGLMSALPVLAQIAGNTANRGPEGTGNFVSGKSEGAKPKERDASYTKPEGEGTNYVGGKPADKGK